MNIYSGTSLGSMALGVREEHTLTMLKRSASIENCAPEGVHKLLHAITLAAYDGDPVPASTVRSFYNQSKKASKQIEHNLGRLSSQPFPMIVSKQETDLNSGIFRDVPLYDVSTGNNTAERYSNVALSELGRLLTRHYKDEPMDFGDHYKSIVPFGLLRKTTAWTMGHRGEMHPLNPKEIMKLQIKMMEQGTPFIEEHDLQEIFRGFDLGEDYKVFMTHQALKTLWTRGESSFIAVPNIVIRPDIGEIHIKVPPLDGTTKDLRDYLNSKELGDERTPPYRTFDYVADVDMIDKGIRIKVTKWHTKNVTEILKELEQDRFISKRVYVRNETIRYRKNHKTSKEEFTTNMHDLAVATITEEDGYTKEELKAMSEKQIWELLSKEFNLQGKDTRVFEKDYYEKVMGSNPLHLEYKEGVGFEDVDMNPYPFELDIVPVWEVLWQAIQWEKEQQIKSIEKELAQLRDQLKYDLLLEKITRPEVAKVIYELQPDYNRKRELLSRTREGSELLPEGLEKWEVDLIYADSANDYLPKIWFRDKYEHLYKGTMEEIERLEKLQGDDQALMNIIKEDLEKFVRNPRYDRKSEVFFLNEDNPFDLETIPVQDNWDDYDLPCTIFYDRNKIRRAYGVNIYFDFKPIWELNTTNHSKVQLLFNRGGKLVAELRDVKDIPTETTTKLPDDFIGVIPNLYGRDVSTAMLFTNLSRYYVYDGLIVNEDLTLLKDEFVLGWVYKDEKYPILDFRTEKGVASLDQSEIKHFESSFKMLPHAYGYVFDIMAKKENDNMARLWLKDVIDPSKLQKDIIKMDRVMLKSKTAQPIEVNNDIVSQVFSPKLNLYYNGYFIWNWAIFGFSYEQHVEKQKYPYLVEDVAVEGEEGYEEYKDRIFRMVTEKYVSEEKQEARQVLTMASYTEDYLHFNIDDYPEVEAIRDVRRKNNE